MVAVTDGVGGPVEARVLAVPEADHAVMVVTGHVGQQLGSGDRRRRQLLVECRGEHDAFGLQLSAGAAELEVEPGQGRPLVTAHEGGGVQPAEAVQAALVEHEPHDRLDPRHEGPAVADPVDVLEAHRSPARSVWAVHSGCDCPPGADTAGCEQWVRLSDGHRLR